MTARGIHSCCPEAPSTINVTQNIIELDGVNSGFPVEVFLGGQITNNLIQLRNTPYAAGSVILTLNSGRMTPGVDYQVAGNLVKLLFTPLASDVIVVNYFARDDGVFLMESASIPVGTIVGFAGSVAPAGWILMDPSQQVPSSFPLLHAFLAEHLDLTVEGVDQGDDPYTLRRLTTTFYDGTTLVSGNSIIKRD